VFMDYDGYSRKYLLKPQVVFKNLVAGFSGFPKFVEFKLFLKFN